MTALSPNAVPGGGVLNDMNGSDHRVTVDQLLQHRGWLQRIAVELAHDEGADAAQDVWAQAVTRPPPSGDNPRGWLRTVLFNRLRSGSRSRSRRLAREHDAAAWSDPPATPEEATARLELQRKLASAMTSLPEPYRHVIYLRFVEDREPAEIAAITATPPAPCAGASRKGWRSCAPSSMASMEVERPGWWS
jgi:RNA polymerase sigma factor (sigma-70 family)